MNRNQFTRSALAGLLVLAAACAPAAPSPTAAPAKPTEAGKPAATAAPAKPALSKAEGPTEAPAAKPAEAKPALSKAEGPAASPAAKPAEAKPAASPVAKPAEAKPAEAKPAASPAAKVDTKAVEAFYRGKTVRIIVGFAPGGGFDTYSRMIARHIGRFIPGTPTVIVENMEGASSRVAANHAFNVAPKDGTVVVNFHGNLFMQQAFGTPGIEFQGERWGFIGVPARDRNLCVASDRSGIKSLQEVQKPSGKQLVLGSESPGSTTYDVAALLTEALELNTKIVQGYRGTAPGRLAMEQGEVDGMCGWSWESAKTSNFADFESGKIVPIVQVTDTPIADMPSKSPVPLARDLARTDDARTLIRVGIENISSFNRPYLAPPGVPADRLQALRTAFHEALKDPTLLDDAQKAKLDINPVSAEELERLVKETLGMSADTKERLKKILAP
jgi:tripartite-type tricarboxylate transporter receptor subunit TctC